MTNPPFNSGPQFPTSPGAGGLPVASGSAFNGAQLTPLLYNYGAGDIVDTLKGWGADIWDVAKKISGDIDWGSLISSGAKTIKDFAAWAMEHKADILAAANVANAAYRQTQADQYAKEAYSGVKDRFEEKRPLRVAGLEGMLHPENHMPDRSNLAALATSGSGNPFTSGHVAGSAPSLPGFNAPREALPVAGAPGAPGSPGASGAPPLLPRAPRTLPVAGTPRLPSTTPPVPPITPPPTTLPLAATGPIQPQAPFGARAPYTYRRPALPPLPIAQG